MSHPPAPPSDVLAPCIRIRGARQHNLRNLNLDLPTGEFIVVTGVSGAGKSSLVFDTLYAEGQRRYVETFSAYARQFLDRMDRPQVDRIEGIPPAIAIAQSNPVRTSRSTVGTMTELNEYIKVLFARFGHLHCRGCARPVQRHTAASIQTSLRAAAHAAGDPRLVLSFPVPVPPNETEATLTDQLAQQGYSRIHTRTLHPSGATQTLHVIQDRFRMSRIEPARLSEACETALRLGAGRLTVHALDEADAEHATWRFATDWICPDCDIRYSAPSPSLFSFNSVIGACESCRGFGRVIGMDLNLIIPDVNKTLAGGAIKPWQSEGYKDCQDDLLRHARLQGVATDIAWCDLPPEHQQWVIEGTPAGAGRSRGWHGVRGFFDWLESKAYKMPIRVLLSRYRSYTPCPACHGARLRPESLLWRVGDAAACDMAWRDAPDTAGHARFRPPGVSWSDAQLATLPGLNLHDLMTLPLGRVARILKSLAIPPDLEASTRVLRAEIDARLHYLTEVGLSYLTLDRPTRTLSGGEMQRIHLVTALGTALVNTLFVLDEPSMGLHPRDMNRVLGVMQRLRDAGNSLVVVEHDPQVIAAADRILDLGPGPGAQGGQVMFWGPPQGLHAAASLTADYLTGRRRMPLAPATTVDASTPRLRLEGARARNLKSIDLEIPLGRLVCLTGVSGSGKSTLMRDVLLPAVRQALGQATEPPGDHDRLLGAEALHDVVFVDQSPLGKTTRSTPVSYVGAFDGIRKRFAAAPRAKERGYTAGTFSFNAGDGRCPACGGLGFEHVEMQFLSDVYLRCADCDGQRYRREVLEVAIDGASGAFSVAEVLNMTVRDALRFFSADREISQRLQTLVEVGLDYLRLGQPVPTLSGGEAQRLKLAGHLAEFAPTRSSTPAAARHCLFMLDEPSTGLHSDDIARLIGSLRQLIAAGHSVLVIEHNLDLIGAADWLIDLGPDAGEQGGELVAAGPPCTLMHHPTSLTAQALRDAAHQPTPWQTHPAPDTAAPPPPLAADAPAPLQVRDSAVVTYPTRPTGAQHIVVQQARTHNLKHIDVTLPHGALTVVTGVSGSGKSSLAFDVIFGEGQRRYLESLNPYARQFVQSPARPDVEAVLGLPPTVAIEQRTSRGGRKSTVGTLTEVYHALRLLYVKLGVQHCPQCAIPIEPQSFEALLARLLSEHAGQTIHLFAPWVVARKGLYTDLAKWARSQGFEQLRVDGVCVPTARFPKLDRHIEHHIELPVAELTVSAAHESELKAALQRALEYGKGFVWVMTQGPTQSATLHSTRRACGRCATSFPELDPRLFSFNSRMGWCPSCLGVGLAVQGRIRTEELTPGLEGETAAGVTYDTHPCPACQGRRLNPTARAVLIQGQSIDALTALSVDAAQQWLGNLHLSGRAAAIAHDLMQEITARLSFLSKVGLGYLALDRSAPTLSGGESQRIRLAAQLGSHLQGVCYVLDEPTIGLHPRDNERLLDMLLTLRDHGNTLLVVEHDEDTIRRADLVIDIGPGSGRHGGQVLACAPPAALAQHPTSLTGRFLSHPLPMRPAPRPCDAHGPTLHIQGARLHNLKEVDAHFPLQRLTVVTGVSGSGKSTLVRGLLLPHLMATLSAKHPSTAPSAPAGCRANTGHEGLKRVLEVDQTPIGQSNRSCPATYIGFWDAIRRLFADTTEARVRGFDASRFSFNTGAGRCPACAGQGIQTLAMSFLPDAKVVCEACKGQRFNPETLAIQWRGHTIGDVLAMDVDGAVEFFAAHPSVHHPLVLMQSLGLGYLTLGQASATLSGGEAQRIKLVTELAKTRTRPGSPHSHTLYVLDEPTVGLHMADIAKLIDVLHSLVDAGHTVIVIEHQMDVWAHADWMIDLGPEGGAQGGWQVDAGPPRLIAQRAIGPTGRALHAFFEARDTPNA